MKKSVCSLALLSALLLGSCAGAAKDQPADAPANQSSGISTAGFPLTVDDRGHQLTLKKVPTRTVPLSQSFTKIQLSLEVADKTVDTTTWTDPVLSSLKSENAKVGRISDDGPTSEVVIAKESDFIMASSPGMPADEIAGSYEKYESFGVSAHLAPGQCGKKSGGDAPAKNLAIEKVYQEVDELSRIHGVPEKGKEPIAQLEQHLEKTVTQKPDKPVKVILWSANSEAPYLASGSGASQFINDQLDTTNIHSNQRDERPQVSQEDIAAENPDVIVMGGLTRKSQTAEIADAKIEYLKPDPITSQMGAVKNERFIKVAGSGMNPSIRTADLAEKLIAGIEQFGLE